MSMRCGTASVFIQIMVTSFCGLLKLCAVLEIVKILMFQTVAIVCKCFLPLNFTK